MNIIKAFTLRHTLLALSAWLLFSSHLKAQKVSIIPQPMEMKINKGTFILDKHATIGYDEKDQEISRIAGFFNDYVEQVYGFRFRKNMGTKKIQFKIDRNSGLEKESYLLKVSNNGIQVIAATTNGLFYGMQSLRQLLPAEVSDGKAKIPHVDIKDQPRFLWRGSMLDVCRHFFQYLF